MNRCQLLRLALDAITNPSLREQLSVEFSATKWYSPMFHEVFHWNKRESDIKYYFSNAGAISQDYTKKIATVLLFDKFTTKWELIEKMKEDDNKETSRVILDAHEEGRL